MLSTWERFGVDASVLKEVSVYLTKRFLSCVRIFFIKAPDRKVVPGQFLSVVGQLFCTLVSELKLIDKVDCFWLPPGSEKETKYIDVGLDSPGSGSWDSTCRLGVPQDFR